MKKKKETVKKGDIHVMIVNLTNVRNLGKGFSQIGLVKMARVVVKVCVGDILLVSRSPRGVLSGFLATDGEPLLQGWNLFPHAICIDLTSQA